MRPLSRWARFPAGRVRHRASYAAYLDSAAWQTIRRSWLEEHRRRKAAMLCAACDQPWTPQGDLHHRTYANVGHEEHADLLPLCRPCHERLHATLDRSPTWRQMSLARATDLLILRLRQGRS